MAVNQSQLQQLIQNSAGTHTAGQANVPSSTQNGNPNSVYNWTTYLPQVSTQNGQPQVNFQLLTSQAPASSAGYATPFTADPYAAMVLAGMPRAGSSSAVNSLLANWGNNGGNPSGPWTGTPNPTTPTPTTPTPTTPAPTGPTRPNVRNGYGPMSVGNLSRPVHNQPWNLQANYNNAMPNVNGNHTGMNAALPWANTTWASTPLGSQAGGGAIVNALRSAGNSLGGYLRDQWNEFVDDITLENGVTGLVGFLADGFIPGGSQVVDWFANKIAERRRNMDPTTPMSEQDVLDINNQLAQQLQGLMSQIMADGGEAAQQRLEAILSRSRSGMPEGWTNETMSARDWQRYQRQFNWQNLMTGRGTGSINPITGLPSDSALGDFMNSISANHMGYLNALSRNRGTAIR